MTEVWLSNGGQPCGEPPAGQAEAQGGRRAAKVKKNGKGRCNGGGVIDLSDEVAEPPEGLLPIELGEHLSGYSVWVAFTVLRCGSFVFYLEEKYYLNPHETLMLRFPCSCAFLTKIHLGFGQGIILSPNQPRNLLQTFL